MRLHIQNMVCTRCKIVVQQELKRLDIRYSSVELGTVKLSKKITKKQRHQLKAALVATGLDLMDDKKKILAEKVKKVIIELVHSNDEQPKMNFSEYLSAELDYDYTYLANVFSEIHGITIEKFLIAHKIERVKELIAYEELNLTEIAYRMHYSSVSHLSTQFKRVTGVPPSHFKLQKKNRDLSLENVGMMKQL